MRGTLFDWHLHSLLAALLLCPAMADRAVLAWALLQPARWTVKDAEDGLKNRYCTRMVRKVVAAGVAAGTFALALRKRGNEQLYELPSRMQQVRIARAATWQNRTTRHLFRS